VSALDVLFDAGFTDVLIHTAGDESYGDFNWTTSALRPDDRRACATVKSDDNLGSVTIQGGNLHLSHFGPTRTHALAALAALAGVADSLLARPAGDQEVSQ
jgi:hypothetical protein